MTTLPTDKNARKDLPIATGVLGYFPDALAAIALVSKLGNDQHNPGQPLHWSRGKSDDHPDCLIRHFLERGTLDTDNTRHSAKVAWRALAILQLEIEAERTTVQTRNPEPVDVRFVDKAMPPPSPPAIREAIEKAGLCDLRPDFTSPAPGPIEISWSDPHRPRGR